MIKENHSVFKAVASMSKEEIKRHKKEILKNSTTIKTGFGDIILIKHAILEVWKNVSGYEGLYQVSSFGNVKSLERDILRKNGQIHYRRKEKLLKLLPDKDGYLSVALCDGKTKRFRVSRLVCAAFYPNPENKTEVNHKNGVQWDNNYNNLEWSTRSENQLHAFRTGLQIASNKNRFGSDSYCSKKVNCLSKEGRFISTHNSIVEAASKTGTDRTGISKVLKGIRPFAGGYSWEYAT